jgi:predicted MPP superfamily phosphohydrolase
MSFRLRQILVFLGIIYFITAFIHTYFWWRMVGSTDLPQPWFTLVTVVLIILAVSFPAPFFARRYLSPAWSRIISRILYVWMGLTLLLLTGFVITDVIRLASFAFQYWFSPHPETFTTSHHLSLFRSLTLGVGLGAVGLAVYSMKAAAQGPVVKKLKIPLKRLPPELSGTLLVQISDLHVGEQIGRDYVSKVVTIVNQLKPDIVAITGDLVDGSVAHLRKHVAPLAELNSTHGVYFVTGNHEYYSGVEEWLSYLPKLGITVLRNERVTIGNGQGSFDLAGVDDSSNPNLTKAPGESVAQALKDLDPKREVILLAHQPKEIFAAASHGVGLQLSGHTHGGQIWPFKFLVRLSQPYISGLAKHQNTYIYVNHGTGFWGPPMRLGSNSEITLIELQTDLEDTGPTLR